MGIFFIFLNTLLLVIFIKNILKTCFVIIGTIIGAGFASGKEIYTFFCIYGINGLWGILISNGIIGLVIYLTFNTVLNNKVKTYSGFTSHLVGKNAVLNYTINNIPVDKFQFATKNDLYHDSKFETKPVSYFQGAFQRFCKNKGAIVGGVVIALLVLFAIFGPLFTPFQPAYYDMVYAYVTPKSNLFANSDLNFWDGCKEKNTNLVGYLKDVALASETGREVIKNGEYVLSEDGSTYSYRYDTYYGVGFGKYKIISVEEFNDIQRYQNETGRQVLYPIVKVADRPTLEKNKYDANVYYKVENPKASILRPKVDKDGAIIPNYWKYEASDPSSLVAEYNSLRIEGENGFEEKGKQYLYAYGRKVDGGIEVRTEYYEYYTYRHSQVLKDGIEALPVRYH